MEPRPPDDKPRTDEVGQFGQLHTCENAYENRKLANFAKSVNFSWMLWWGSKTRPHPTKREDGSGGTLPFVRQGVNG